MKSKILFIVLLFFVSLSTASVIHEVEADESAASFNTTLELSSENPVNSWNFNYRLPANVEIEHIEDSYGEIEEYSFNGERVSLQTNRGSSRTNEYVRIRYRTDAPAEEIGKGLYSREINFAGYRDQETSGKVVLDNIISGKASYGFETSYNDSMNFRGDGPVRITVNFGDGTETKYYSYFGRDYNNLSLDEMDEAYELALGTVRYQQDFERFPVIIDDNYQGEEWSAGEYFQSRITLRPEEELIPVLAHETVHGLNDKVLSWDNTRSAWFDEGIAKHVEDLARVKLNGRERTSELFGEDVQYREGGFIYTLPSRGDRNELWEYYQSDYDFMKEWSPREGNRGFGYSYSELIIKNYLKQNGTVNEIYSNVDPGRTVESNEEKWQIYSNYLDLRPCDYENREKFNQCLDDINDYEYEVLMAEPVKNTNQVNVREVNIPKREPISRPEINVGGQNIFILLENLINRLFEALGI